MNIAITIANLVLGVIAIGLMARTLSFSALRRRAARRRAARRVLVPYASVFPLVTARAVARAFTYEVPDDVGVGAIVRVPFGRSRARGIVTELVDCGAGRRRGTADRGRRRGDPAGARRARALARRLLRLDARACARARRARLAEAPQGAGAAGGTAGARRRGGAGRALRDAARGGRAHRRRRRPETSCSTARPVLARRRSTCRRARRCSSAASARSSSFPRSRSRRRPSAACARASVSRSRSSTPALTEAERRDERERIARGEARIVVGARSAVFAPIRGLGLIVVDEEHDPSYKQDSDPRYDARTVAAKRASLEGAVAVYGSATPRPESWAALERLELGGRLGASLPPVRVVDLRREAGYPLSAPLLDALRRVAENRSKAILLLNRRGVAPALHCRACGTTIRCPNCDVALVLHGDASLRCHHCGFTRDAPALCPTCGSPDLARLGAGTQKLERDLARELPDLELIRLDADAVAKPEQLAASLARFAAAEGAVLLGTQMVAKGHHFAGRRARSRRRRRHRARAAGLPRRGADVPADHAARRPERPRCAGPRARPDVPARSAAGRARRPPRRVAVPDGGARAAARARVPAVRAPRAHRRHRPAIEPVVQALDELKAGIKGAELLGPAALLRLRGKHRAQLVAKTTQPRRIASQAAHLLVRRRAGDAARGTHCGGRRRSAKLVAMAKRRPEDVIGEWGIRDVDAASQASGTRCATKPSSTRSTGRPLEAPHPPLPPGAGPLPRLARRAAAVHAPAAADRRRDRRG